MGSQQTKPSRSSDIGIGQTLYQDAASLGRFKALVILILGGVVSLILFLTGIYRLFAYRIYSLTADSKVTQVTGCMKTQDINKKWNFDCTTSIEYTINDKKYQNSIKLSKDNEIKIDDMIPIYYNPSNPNEISVETSSSGWVFIVMSVFVLLLSYLMYWLSMNYTFFAAAEGTSFITNLFRQ